MLLGVLLLCASISMFHVRGITDNNEQLGNTNSSRLLDSMNAQDAFDYLVPLLIAGTINGAAGMLKQFAPEVRDTVVTSVLDEENTHLKAQDKITFLIAAVQHYTEDQDIQYALLDSIAQHKEHLPYQYTLQSATQDAYVSTIEPLLQWIAQRRTGKKYKRFAKKLFDEGLENLITHNDVHALDVLLSKKMPLRKQQATALLHTVVLKNRDPEFVSLLVQRAGANVNYTDKSKHTLLMHAVTQNNVPMTHVLLQEGAKPNKLTSPAIGTALQLAIQKRYVEVELLLRRYGARE